MKDNRGGSIPKLDAETINNSIDIVVNHSPTEFGFSTFIWTCELLKIYVEQNFGQKVSNETIRRILIKNRISYKRAQPKSTKADIEKQNEFKKMLNLLPILESSSDTIVYALDEIGISVELDNYSSWSPVGHHPIIEKNARHEGINIIGSTAILNRYYIIIDTYPSSTSIKSKEVKTYIQYLLDIN